MKSHHIITVLTALGLPGYTFAESTEKSVTFNELPASVATVIKAAAGSTKVFKIQMEVENGITTYEAIWGSGGQRREIHVTGDGKSLGVVIPLAEVPELVRLAILQKSGAGRVAVLEKKLGNGKSFYEASFQNGKDSIEMKLDENGKVLEGGTNTPAPDNADQKDKSGYGKFVSFKDGTLTLKGNYSGLLWSNIPEKTPVVHWDDAANKYVPSGTAEVLSKVEAGTWTTVAPNKELIRIGAKKGQTTGTFVSFKDDRLLMLGKDLGPSFTKKYGNQLHFHKFAAGVPVYESIDGGEYQPVGTAETVLPKVKEGTVLTVHGAGDDNITRIDIGVPKSK